MSDLNIVYGVSKEIQDTMKQYINSKILKNLQEFGKEIDGLKNKYDCLRLKENYTYYLKTIETNYDSFYLQNKKFGFFGMDRSLYFIGQKYKTFDIDMKDTSHITSQYGSSTKWFVIRNGNILYNFYPKTIIGLIGTIGISSLSYYYLYIRSVKEWNERQIKRNTREHERQIQNSAYDDGIKSITNDQIPASFIIKYRPLLIHIYQKKNIENILNQQKEKDEELKNLLKEIDIIDA